MNRSKDVRWVIVRDMLIFQMKLFLDAAKDLVFAPLALGATVLDLLVPRERPGERFYGVMRLGEKFDRWVSLFSAAEKADATEDGLFGASRAGADSFLGKLEELVLGESEELQQEP